MVLQDAWRWFTTPNLCMNAILKDIKTETFNRILEAYLEAGWKAVFVYNGTDAWIDYGRVDLERADLKLCFEWTNWFEGEITGIEALIQEIKQTFDLE
jgi:hypothetical protein